MTYDVVIRNGLLIDGSGAPARRADVGLEKGRIAAVGDISDGGAEEIDADGHVVCPGFIDGHTHLDAQIFWDPELTSLSWHGVTTAVMGNCGFTLAPGASAHRDLAIRSLERAEDIPRESIESGVPWNWETFADFLQAVDQLPKALNVAAYLGHSALRTFVMGERGFDSVSTPDDMVAMKRELTGAIEAGAIGFSTSRSFNHNTYDDRPVASRLADWAEVTELVGTMADAGGGIFQLAPERPTDPNERAVFWQRLHQLAVSTRCPVTLMAGGDRETLDALQRIVDDGGQAFGQVHVREFQLALSFRGKLPFDHLPAWRELRAASPDEQRTLLRTPESRARLIEAALTADYGAVVGADARAPVFSEIMVVDDPFVLSESVEDVARRRGVSPLDAMIDLALESDFEQIFVQPLGGIRSEESVMDALRHPRSIVAASDSGAHLAQILDSAIPTILLGHWVRDRELMTWEEAIRLLTHDPAVAFGFTDRGVVEVGARADLLVIDPDRIGAELPAIVNDLPTGAPRLVQRATGYQTIIVNGTVTVRDDQHVGAFPGALVRRGS